MRAFISHTFAKGADERLARTLREELSRAGIDGYLAEKIQRYDLLIHDKIQQAIGESEWLVAIITRAAQRSASVHEEIGYALGRGVKVIIMLEKGAKESGVLVYGRESEVFSPRGFRVHAQRVAEFIRDAPLPKEPKPGRLSRDAEQLLDDRKILLETSDVFAQNRHFSEMYAEALPNNEKPVVLFTACPHELVSRDIVATGGFVEWAKGIRHVDAEGHQIPIRGLDHEIDTGSLTFIERQYEDLHYPNVRSYREFHDSGFFECGASLPYVYRNHRNEPTLHLCLLIGNFWGFLLHTRLFYQRIGLGGPFTALLSIRNSSELALGNHGDESTDPEWRYARMPSSSLGDPRTDRRHIQLRHAFGSVHEMTDQKIANATRDAARKICNAYGQISPECYSSGGQFSWRLWEMVQL